MCLYDFSGHQYAHLTRIKPCALHWFCERFGGIPQALSTNYVQDICACCQAEAKEKANGKITPVPTGPNAHEFQVAFSSRPCTSFPGCGGLQQGDCFECIRSANITHALKLGRYNEPITSAPELRVLKKCASDDCRELLAASYDPNTCISCISNGVKGYPGGKLAFYLKLELP